jgi:hypothetical protein
MQEELEEDFEQRLSGLEQEVAQIQARNSRVELDKAWEVSLFRTSFIVCSTYFVTALVFYFIDVPHPLRNAAIPTVGYYLSTLSLPRIKQWWIKSASKG